MTLDKIDQRLHLFKEYMKYRLDNWQCCIKWAPLILEINMNRWWYHYETPFTFDQWLYQNGHQDLIF